jgi:hypothetical protein
MWQGESMMTRPLNDIELEVLENGEDDWVLFAHIMGIHNEAQGLSLDEAKSVELASSTCLTLCALGLSRLGRYTEEHSFVSWPETGVQLKARLQAELSSPPPGHDMNLNQQWIMLDILPEGLNAWHQQRQ